MSGARSRSASRGSSRSAFSVSGPGASGPGASPGASGPGASVAPASGVPYALPPVKIVGLLYWIACAIYVNSYQGRRWELFVSDGLACGAAGVLVLLDPTKPEYKQQALGACLVMTIAFTWNGAVPHFAAASDLIQKMITAMPKADKMYGQCVKILRKMDAEHPFFGIANEIIQHDNLTTTIDTLLKK